MRHSAWLGACQERPAWDACCTQDRRVHPNPPNLTGNTGKCSYHLPAPPAHDIWHMEQHRVGTSGISSSQRTQLYAQSQLLNGAHACQCLPAHLGGSAMHRLRACLTASQPSRQGCKQQSKVAENTARPPLQTSFGQV